MLAPCALGGVLNDDTVPALRCRAIAGAANNQLAADELDAAAGRARHPVGAGLRLQRRRHHQHRRRARARGLRARPRRHARPRRRRHAAHRSSTAPPPRGTTPLRRRARAGPRAAQRGLAPSSRSFSRCARSVIAANGRTAARRVGPGGVEQLVLVVGAPGLERGEQLRSRSARWARYSSSFAAGSSTGARARGRSRASVERAQPPQPVEVLAQAPG